MYYFYIGVSKRFVILSGIHYTFSPVSMYQVIKWSRTQTVLQDCPKHLVYHDGLPPDHNVQSHSNRVLLFHYSTFQNFLFPLWPSWFMNICWCPQYYSFSEPCSSFSDTSSHHLKKWTSIHIHQRNKFNSNLSFVLFKNHLWNVCSSMHQ